MPKANQENNNLDALSSLLERVEDFYAVLKSETKWLPPNQSFGPKVKGWFPRDKTSVDILTNTHKAVAAAIAECRKFKLDALPRVMAAIARIETVLNHPLKATGKKKYETAYQEFFERNELYYEDVFLTMETARDHLQKVVFPLRREQREADKKAKEVARDGYVTLEQMAILVNRKKKTLANYNSEGRMPAPDIAGGQGKPAEWRWDKIRPWLEKTFGRTLSPDLRQLMIDPR